MDSRYYTIDGERYPRVSAVLSVISKPFLATWRGKVGNVAADRIAREATTFGTVVHEACAHWCTQLIAHESPFWAGDPALTPFVMALASWLDAQVQSVMDVERLVVSRKWKFAGTCDLLLVMRDGSLCLADIKTSKQLASEYALQLAAYRCALREEGLDVTRRLVLWLPRLEPGVVKAVEYDDHEGDEKTFLHALFVFRWTESASAPTPHKELA